MWLLQWKSELPDNNNNKKVNEHGEFKCAVWVKMDW